MSDEIIEEKAEIQPVATVKPIKVEGEQAEIIRTAIRASHTIATLEVSIGTYAEVKMLLKEAGYEHAFDGDMIDMSGIGLVLPPAPTKVDIFINGKPFSVPYHEGKISYEEIRDLAFPDSDKPKFPSCTWRVKSSGLSGILYPGKGVMLEAGLILNITDTSNA